jgi:very-short-patch-repair endonuclease
VARKSKATKIPGWVWEANGLPAPVINHRFHHARRWMIDFSYPDRKIAIEIEGGLFVNGGHVRGAYYIDNMEKYNAETLLGWRLLRYAPGRVNFNEIRELYNKG